jgi:hypothetical protein
MPAPRSWHNFASRVIDYRATATTSMLQILGKFGEI